MPAYDTEQILGHTPQEAAAYLAGLSMALRVTVEDGVPLGVTADYTTRRVNVHVTAGIITEIGGVG